MKLMKTEDAVGQVLCHDITQIIKGVTKDAVFRKGHIITEEDIPVLLSVGKDNIYIWEKDDTMLHENEAAQILYDMCKNDHMHPSDVKEGKIELIADCDGLLKVDREKLKKVNSLGEMMIATRHGDTYVKKGDKLAGTRIIPLVIKKALADEPIPVYGNGANVRDWLHVYDHCTAIDLIVRKGRDGEVYNIGGHNEKSNLEVVKCILHELGKPESLITFVKDRAGHDLRYAMDPTKIMTELGWKPKYTFKTGIGPTIRWNLEHQEWLQNIISGEYLRFMEKNYGGLK